MPRKKSGNGPVKIESIAPAIAEIERAIVWAYNLTGDRPLDSNKIIVVVQTRGQKKNHLGHFLKQGWETKEGEPIHEISLSAEFLSRPVLEVIETVIHETGHLWNSDADIKDCSDGGRHNKKFKEAAEMLGLICEKGSNGWNATTMGEELKLRVEKEFQPDYDAFRLARLVQVKASKPPSMAKWSCSEGCTVVRASIKVEVLATCEKCGNPFLTEDETL